MTRVFAIILNDARVNRNTIALLLVAIPCIAVVGPALGLGRTRTAAMLLALGGFVGPVMFPYWVVGMDRLKGPMQLLVGLPISRFGIVQAKALGAVLLSCVLTLAAVVCALPAGLIDPVQTRAAFEIAPVLIVAACTVSTAIYFLFPARIATIAVSACIACGAPFFGPLLGALPHANAWLLVAAYGGAVVIAAAALYLTERIWSRRPSPCD